MVPINVPTLFGDCELRANEGSENALRFFTYKSSSLWARRLKCNILHFQRTLLVQLKLAWENFSISATGRRNDKYRAINEWSLYVFYLFIFRFSTVALGFYRKFSISVRVPSTCVLLATGWAVFSEKKRSVLWNRTPVSWKKHAVSTHRCERARPYQGLCKLRVNNFWKLIKN